MMLFLFMNKENIENYIRTASALDNCGAYVISDMLDRIVNGSNLRCAQTIDEISKWGYSNPLDLFGIKPGDNVKAKLRKSYQTLTKQWHHDIRGGDETAQRIFNHCKEEVDHYLSDQRYRPISYFERWPEMISKLGVTSKSTPKVKPNPSPRQRPSANPQQPQQPRQPRISPAEQQEINRQEALKRVYQEFVDDLSKRKLQEEQDLRTKMRRIRRRNTQEEAL